MATAVIVQYMVSGTMWVESRLRVNPLVWIGLGLLAAVTAGLIAWSAGLPFLSSRTVAFDLPVIGAMHLSTTLLFDLGVFMVVVGATLLMLVALAHQSLRSPRKTVTPVSPDAEDSRVLGAGAA
jgi:multicomponent K+:H+ antiporter subunit A